MGLASASSEYQFPLNQTYLPSLVAVPVVMQAGFKLEPLTREAVVERRQTADGGNLSIGQITRLPHDAGAPLRSDGAGRSRSAVSHAVKVERYASCRVGLVARRNHRAGKHDPD